jgi:hypothetical protein
MDIEQYLDVLRDLEGNPVDVPAGDIQEVLTIKEK